MLKDVNDRDEHADQLAVLLEDIPAKVNLIPFNPGRARSTSAPTGTGLRPFPTVF